MTHELVFWSDVWGYSCKSINLSSLVSHPENWVSIGQVTAWRLTSDKPIPEPILAYCKLDSWERISMKFELKLYYFVKKMHLKLSSAKNGCNFVQGEMSQGHGKMFHWFTWCALKIKTATSNVINGDSGEIASSAFSHINELCYLERIQHLKFN